jgi:hypothetical protein
MNAQPGAVITVRELARGLDRATTLMSRLAIQVDGIAALHEPPLSKAVTLRKVVG